MPEKLIFIEDEGNVISLFGQYDENIKLLESQLGTTIIYRNGNLKISGSEENIDKTEKVINKLTAILKKVIHLTIRL